MLIMTSDSGREYADRGSFRREYRSKRGENMSKTKVCFSDSGRKMEFVLDDFGKDTVVVGRSTGCDIRLVNPKVSSSHGCFYKNQGQWCYQDMKSTNGSSMNGTPITSITVRDGDKIFLESTPKENSTFFQVIQSAGAAAAYAGDAYGQQPYQQSYGAQSYQTPVAQPYQAPVQPYQAPVQPAYYAAQPVYVAPVSPYPIYALQPKPPVSALAVISMIFGILAFLASIILLWIFFFYNITVPLIIGITALVAVILAIPAMAGRKGGKGMAIAGLVLGILTIIRLVIYWITYSALISYYWW